MNIPIRSEWLKAAKLLPTDAERWQFLSACIEYSQTAELPPAPPKENTKKRDTKVSPKESGLSFEQLIPPALNTVEFSIAWQQWCKYHKALRHTMTELTAKSQLEMLGRYPPAVAIAAIDQSIQMGWQGLFPDKITIAAGKLNKRDYTKV